MTENEASVRLEVIRAGLLSGTDVKVVSSEENIKSIDAAIDAIEENQQYRAIGTPEECRAAVAVKKEVQDIVDRLEELKEEKTIGSHKVMIKEAIEIVRGEADA